LVSIAITGQAMAGKRIVASRQSLQNAIQQAEPGDTLILESGEHAGPVTIDRSLILRGRRGAIIDGGRESSVIAIRADHVRIEGLTIRKSGLCLGKDDAGIHSTEADTEVVNHRIESCLHGVYFREVRGGLIRGNTVIGATKTNEEPKKSRAISF
jgi:nitrous oxidase accessory protein